MGFTSGLLLLFIGLKLAGIIAWSWWWVMSPLWIIVLLLFFVAILGGTRRPSKNRFHK